MVDSCWGSAPWSRPALLCSSWSGAGLHTTRIVALDRIRGVDLQAPWLHRLLGLVQVEVDAAAGGSSGSELTLAAVSAQ